MEDKCNSNFETLLHIMNVRKFIDKMIIGLIKRSQDHDKTKLEEPESSIFAEYTHKLADSTYGSEEYKQFLEDMKPAIEHHYLHNRHHPEGFSNGVDGMNLLDVIEMFCDWKAASLRHNNGDIYRSVEINKERFKLSEQLTSILRNTISLLEDEE